MFRSSQECVRVRSHSGRDGQKYSPRHGGELGESSLVPRLLPPHAIIPRMTFDTQKVICGIITCGRREKPENGARVERGLRERVEREGRERERQCLCITVLPSIISTRLLQPSFMNQFQDEQDKFTREKRRLRDAAVPPWVGYNEEEQMKAQIMELSAVRYPAAWPHSCMYT